MGQQFIARLVTRFSATIAQGETVSLSQYRGKYVVLEWMDPACAFVKGQYNSGNMPAKR